MSNTELTVGIPVRNSFDYFKKCFDSIIDHTDVSFELIIMDDASSDNVKHFVEGLKKADVQAALWERSIFLKRIRIMRSDKQKGFPVSCNQIIKESKGQYVAIVTSDTVATPEWASHMIGSLNKYSLGAIGPMTSHCASPQKMPEYEADKETVSIEEINKRSADLWKKYGDEVTRIGELTGFFILFRKESLRQLHIQDACYFDESYGLGSGEDFDICFRLTMIKHPVGYANGIYIHHYGHKTFGIEKGLDSRALWGKNANKFQAKKKVIKENMERAEQQPKRRKETPAKSAVQVTPKPKPKIVTPAGPAQADIIFVRYNCEEVENEAIESVLYRTEGVKFHFHIVDNYDTGESLTGVWNRMIDNSKCPYVCLLNSDTVIQDGLWLAKLVDSMKQDDQLAVVGPSTNNCRSKRQNGHRLNDSLKYPNRTTHVSELSGFCFLLRKSIWEELGRFNEKDFPLYGSESEYVHRVLKNGYRVGWRQNSFVYHHGSTSAYKAEAAGELNVEEERAKARKKYKEICK